MHYFFIFYVGWQEEFQFLFNNNVMQHCTLYVVLTRLSFENLELLGSWLTLVNREY